MCYFICRAQKNTISWGFNLIFNTLGTGHYLSPGGGGGGVGVGGFWAKHDES